MYHEDDGASPFSTDPKVSTAGGVAVESGHLGVVCVAVPA